MIDWVNLAFNALWIFALAVLLASLSYASWEASIYKVKMRERLKLPAYQASINLAALLFCAGLAGLAGNLLIRIVWIILAMISLVYTVLAWKTRQG